MPAYQIEVGGQLDGATPLVLPSPLPAATDGGVIKLDVAINVGAIDLNALSRQAGSAVWVRAIHIEFGSGTRACRCELSYRGTATRQLVTPVLASDGPLFMRPFTLNPGAIAPPGSTLRITTDDIGPDFAGSFATGPHFVYLDVVSLADGDIVPLVQVMLAQAELKEHADGDVLTSCQAVAASLNETVGVWQSPVEDRVGSNVDSGQLVSVEVTVGTAAAAGESMRVEIFQDLDSGTESLGFMTIDDTIAANSRVDLPITLPNNELVSGTAVRVNRTYTPGGAPAPMTDTCVRGDDFVSRMFPSFSTLMMVPVSATAMLTPVIPISR